MLSCAELRPAESASATSTSVRMNVSPFQAFIVRVPETWVFCRHVELKREEPSSCREPGHADTRGKWGMMDT